MKSDLDSLISRRLSEKLLCDIFCQQIIDVKKYVLAILVIHQEPVILAAVKELKKPRVKLEWRDSWKLLLYHHLGFYYIEGATIGSYCFRLLSNSHILLLFWFLNISTLTASCWWFMIIVNEK